MKVCMVTPHLPPDQAANALLPQLLAEGLERRGDEVSFVVFEPKYASAVDRKRTVYIRRPRDGWVRKARISQLVTLLEVFRKARNIIRYADVVHLHSNTFMNQVAAVLAHLGRRPFILTHYGTEIWHFKRRPVDPFLWMNHKAAQVTYYSRMLLERSLELGVKPLRPSVVYPPVGNRFRTFSRQERDETRQSLGVGKGPLLINVKRLHPLAGQRFLVEAMPEILSHFPEAKLWIAGEGESRGELEALIAKNRLGSAVRLLGLVDNRELPRFYAAADLFVLPSLLEAFPTVAAEALACGTPVVSADHPGGLEIKEIFAGDVQVVPRRNPASLAEAIIRELSSAHRSSEETLERIESDFRPDAAVEKYRNLYQEALALAKHSGGSGA